MLKNIHDEESDESLHQIPPVFICQIWRLHTQDVRSYERFSEKFFSKNDNLNYFSPAAIFNLDVILNEN